MKNYIQDKVIIITGAASGFGRVLSRRTAEMGAKVICADINEAGLKETVEIVRGIGGSCEYIVTDVSKKDQTDAMAKLAIDTYGRIDILINSAGTMPICFYSDHEIAWQAWERCIDTNIKGTVFAMGSVYDQMKAQGAGHIVNFSSIHAISANAGAGIYGASKIAVRYLTEAMRQENPGLIRTTVVYPTAVDDTGLAAGIMNWDACNALYTEKGGKFYPEFYASEELRKSLSDREKINFCAMDPESLCEQVIYAMNQPWGIEIAEVTVRATGDMYR